MTKAAIIAALSALDANNDNHWTQDGLPRLETVRMKAGNQTLTREDINLAAPGFSRANPVTGAQAEQQGNATTATASTAIAAPAGDTQAAVVVPATNGGDDGEVDAQAEEGNAETEGGALAKLEKELAVAQERLAEIKQQKILVDREIAEGTAYIDKLLVAIEAERPATSTPATIQGYLASQARELERRAERAKQLQALKERGLDLNAMREATSDLDAALGKRNGRGRPQF